MGRESQVLALPPAMLAAIAADAPLAAALTKTPTGRASELGVYAVRAPSDVAPPFVTVTGWGEAEWGLFGRSGTTMAPLVHIWTTETGYLEWGALYARLRDVFHERRFAMGDGLAVVASELELIDASQDPDGVTMHAVCRLTVTARPAA